MEEEEEEDQREMARTKGTKRMETSAVTDKSHLRIRYTFSGRTDRRLSYMGAYGSHLGAQSDHLGTQSGQLGLREVIWGLREVT